MRARPLVRKREESARLLLLWLLYLTRKGTLRRPFSNRGRTFVPNNIDIHQTYLTINYVRNMRRARES